MDYSKYDFKPIDKGNLRFLEDMLYLAVYVGEKGEVPSRDIIYEPNLYKYIRDWNNEKDLGYIAIDKKTGNKVGAVWLRTFSRESKGYGYINDNIPELSIAVYSDYRGKGIGTKLIKYLFSKLPIGIHSISLSVDIRNPAKRLYERFGFKDFSINDGTAIMRYDRYIKKNMPITIHLLSKCNAEEILAFEKQNKDFFETVIPPRGNSYYNIENLKQILEEIEEEQSRGLCYMYLIRNEKEELVGRVNLFSIVRGIFQKAEIGYRIGKEYNGKGYAIEAVKLACNEAFQKYQLHRIEAGTCSKNIGSQIVLIKNGFEFIGRTRKVININGKWEDGILFEKLNEN